MKRSNSGEVNKSIERGNDGEVVWLVEEKGDIKGESKLNEELCMSEEGVEEEEREEEEEESGRVEEEEEVEEVERGREGETSSTADE